MYWTVLQCFLDKLEFCFVFCFSVTLRPCLGAQDHFLFDKPVSPLLTCAGMARDWPDARGIWYVVWPAESCVLLKDCLTNLLACPDPACTLAPHSQHIQFALKKEMSSWGWKQPFPSKWAGWKGDRKLDFLVYSRSVSTVTTHLILGSNTKSAVEIKQ